MPDIKQVIVLRTLYPDGRGGFFKPRTGKLVAQGAHASMKVFFDQMQDVGGSCKELGPQEGWDWHGAVLPWINGLFTKVCLQVKSEEALLALAEQANAAYLPCALIQDAGLTEFGGVPTWTCVAIGPAPAADIDRITGSLSLL